MNIAKEIKGLLNYHECVIIPGFGSFISNYRPARYNSLTHTFEPPSKEVVFNSKITRNDGLLANQIVESEGIGYHQANMAVRNFVDDLFKTLNKGEKSMLEGLGTFSFDKSGHTVFMPESSFVYTEAYGLQQFTWIPEKDSGIASIYKARPAVRAIRSRKDIIKIAASITLLLGLSLFPLKNESPELQLSNTNIFSVLTEPVPAKSKVVDSESNFVSSITDSFVLVGGSFQHSENAITLKDQFAGQGFNSEIIKMDDGLFRVIVDSYSNKAEALHAMDNYRAKYPGSGVWVSTR
jgi:nucleoid DNA-binding protein